MRCCSWPLYLQRGDAVYIIMEHFLTNSTGYYSIYAVAGNDTITYSTGAYNQLYVAGYELRPLEYPGIPLVDPIVDGGYPMKPL